MSAKRSRKKRPAPGTRTARFFIILLLLAIAALSAVLFITVRQEQISHPMETFSSEWLGALRTQIRELDPEEKVISLPSDEKQDEVPESAGAAPAGSSSVSEESSDESAGETALEEAESESETEETKPALPPLPPAVRSSVDEADIIAAGYDYDTASEMLKAIPSWSDYPAVEERLQDYARSKEALVPADVLNVPHIFYHSLLNDTSRAFNKDVLGDFAVDGMNAWMTTIEEFDAITQELYDRGYVYVRLRDLVVETKSSDGSVSFKPNEQLMLPPGKKPIVLSIDDLSYYHSYEPAGFPEKLVLDENGLVKCLYTDAEGNTSVGDFDVVPRLNTFLRAHPDGAYRGARGLIAMTGYNGVFGYRTDSDYETRESLIDDQIRWLDAHPDFNRQKEIEQATVIADAIKKEGWEFASHTWGHLSVTEADLGRLKTDNERWVENVRNITGPVDTIIFAHGNDIGNWEEYSASNEKYQYYYRSGYRFYCNVDGSVPSWIQITDKYVRQGRIDMDGYMLYRASLGETHVLDQLVDASKIFDQRRPTPVVANGQG